MFNHISDVLGKQRQNLARIECSSPGHNPGVNMIIEENIQVNLLR